MEQGQVDYFHETSGYGFIQSPAIDDDVFFHMSEVGEEDPNEGDYVKFRWKLTEKGPRATRFEILNDNRSSGSFEIDRQDSLALDPNYPWEVPDESTVSIDVTWDDWSQGELIEKGGSAFIYEAMIESSERQIPAAVKMLPSTGKTKNFSELSSLTREAQNWSRIDDHPHIVTLYDYGEEPATWILMERMSGGTLADRLPLAPGYALGILDAICSGVQHAHDIGIFHGDLKPRNILFSEFGKEGVPKVGDWGLARVLFDATKSTRDDYTVAYAPPEKIREEDMTAQKRRRRDVYQLGAIAYEALTGEQPFDGETIPSIINSILSETPQPPSEIRSEIPESLDKPIMAAISSESENRPASVRAFSQTILDIS